MLVLHGYQVDGPGQLYNAFWSERFCIDIDARVMEDCVVHAFPWIVQHRRNVEELIASGRAKSVVSGPNNLKACEMLGKVLVQDSLVKADLEPDNILVRYMSQLPAWRLIRMQYINANAQGVSRVQREGTGKG